MNRTLNRILVVAFGVGLLVYWLNAYSYEYEKELSFYPYMNAQQKSYVRAQISAFVDFGASVQEAVDLLEHDRTNHGWFQVCQEELKPWCAEFAYHTDQCYKYHVKSERFRNGELVRYRTAKEEYNFLTCTKERTAHIDPLDARWFE